MMCGFLNMDTAEKLNMVAIMVSGVRDFDVLEAEIKVATSKARIREIKIGMKRGEIIKLFL